MEINTRIIMGSIPISHSKKEYICVNLKDTSGTMALQGVQVENAHDYKYLVQLFNKECGKEIKK